MILESLLNIDGPENEKCQEWSRSLEALVLTLHGLPVFFLWQESPKMYNIPTTQLDREKSEKVEYSKVAKERHLDSDDMTS